MASRLVMAANLCASNVSRLTLMRVRPAAARSGASLRSRKPLVVKARLFSPGIAERRAISSGSWGRKVGSPPVRRISSIPQSHGQSHQAFDLVKGQDLIARQPIQPLGRHTVGAAEVAAINERYPQIADAAPERILQGAFERHRTPHLSAQLLRCAGANPRLGRRCFDDHGESMSYPGCAHASSVADKAR